RSRGVTGDWRRRKGAERAVIPSGAPQARRRGIAVGPAEGLGSDALTVQEGGLADVLVAYGVGLARNLEINGSSSGWGGPLYRGNRTGSARTEEVVTGTLVVAMADPETKSVVWRGVASKDLDQNASPDKRDKNLNKAVARMLEKYPPKK
ncbi:MAG TPA: DUF4136 domain-containing protein, partial [Gemmatimonadaceae bacterium]|nr:DUF4136 domain-containing protein [Gemmatimonadaceae bacterium]